MMSAYCEAYRDLYCLLMTNDCDYKRKSFRKIYEMFDRKYNELRYELMRNYTENLKFTFDQYTELTRTTKFNECLRFY